MFGEFKCSWAANNHSMKEPGFKSVSLAASSGLLLQSVSCRSLNTSLTRPRPVFSSVQVDNNIDPIALWWEMFGDSFWEGLGTGLVTERGGRLVVERLCCGAQESTVVTPEAVALSRVGSLLSGPFSLLGPHIVTLIPGSHRANLFRIDTWGSVQENMLGIVENSCSPPRKQLKLLPWSNSVLSLYRKWSPSSVLNQIIYSCYPAPPAGKLTEK